MVDIYKTPSANNMFIVREYEGTLTGTQADLFQTLVAKILFVRCRSRPDLKMALDFLTTQVRNPDGDEYKKLNRTIHYIGSMQVIELTLEAESMDTIRWWIDAAYGVHPDLKGYSGGMMSLGKGAASRKSIRHKINPRGSTKSWLIGVDDHMPGVLWTLRFLRGQVFKVNENILYQDKQSSILMERNWKYFCGKKTRHIDMRYFFITGRIK